MALLVVTSNITFLPVPSQCHALLFNHTNNSTEGVKEMKEDSEIQNFRSKHLNLNSRVFSLRTNYTEWPPLVGEISANFCG
jgi:hypothetical protein